MSCAFSREMLALHAEGDLPAAAADTTSAHLATCVHCRQFLEHLDARQALVKSLRLETVSRADCEQMRRDVMARINDGRDRSGWMLRVERAVLVAVQQRSLATAAFLVLGIVSVSVLAQMRDAGPVVTQVATLRDGQEDMQRPEGYRNWVAVNQPMEPGHRSTDASATRMLRSPNDRVYIDPAAYRRYVKTGTFPEGTLMIWESGGRGAPLDGPHAGSSQLLASVKNSARFDGGWGFFDFTGPDGAPASTAQALPESSGCRTCHRRDAATDHVFTQFYPALESARRGAERVEPVGINRS